ncbi:DUF1795 domain-containing protein [Pararobbsia alpina]
MGPYGAAMIRRRSHQPNRYAVPSLRALFSTSFRRFAIALLIPIVAACSAKFDWRTITNDDGRFSVMYPSKPGLDERVIPIAGHALKMQMQSAKVGGALFAVGSVLLPSEDPALQRAVLEALETGLARNVGIDDKPSKVQIALTENGQFVDGEALSGSGKVAGRSEHRTVAAHFVIRGQRVIQAVVISDKEVPAEQVAQFLDSLRVY